MQDENGKCEVFCMNKEKNPNENNHICIGLLAHVDAGKTTLSEALLYQTGQIRTLGRVDHGDTHLDTDEQERKRGITIFSKQAELADGEWSASLLDTPGHADFSAEMERTLQVLDYAVLVISGTDGVQGHTGTLWRLLAHYRLPVFLFINKMDLEGADAAAVDQELKQMLSDGCVDFTDVCRTGKETEKFYEELAVTDEALLNEYMETGRISRETIRSAVADRLVFPCFYGSALKVDGIDTLLAGMKEFMKAREYPEEFSARVYKIARDPRGVRLSYLKVTGGTLHVKDRIAYAEKEEKADQLRIYSGEKYEPADCVPAGGVCAVAGLTATVPGMGLGACGDVTVPVLEPVLSYRLLLPEDVNPASFYLKIRQLEEEDPQLYLVWKEELQEIHVQIMGQVQMEVLAGIIKERFGTDIRFGRGSIVYKETIAKPVEGVGHFEPLRHYAEVHLLLEPGEPGSGVQAASGCSEDVLDANWQRLIASHVLEREHPGVLTGSAVTDIKCTILTGKAHIKHTEGGDFRQATYRAIRQGLKSTECILLEPYYAFTLQIPAEYIGRALTDIRQRFGAADAPEYRQGRSGETAVVKGRAPVSAMQDYVTEVGAYTGGRGSLALEPAGYDVCHNAKEVIEETGYDSEADTANPTGSVFCSHGAGLYVPWNEVPDYMHLEYAYPKKKKSADAADGFSYEYAQGQAFGPERTAHAKEQKSVSAYELDRELQQIYAREFGMNKADMEEQERKRWAKKQAPKEPVPSVKYDQKGRPIYPKKGPEEEFMIVDGYNIIFAWEELNDLAKRNIDSARDKLKDILSNYQGYRGGRMLLVFDAYKRKGNPGKSEQYHNIQVVYTRQDETADMYIEKKVHELRGKYKVTVATSDGLEQLTVLSMGALRMSAKGLFEEIRRAEQAGYEAYRLEKEQADRKLQKKDASGGKK